MQYFYCFILIYISIISSSCVIWWKIWNLCIFFSSLNPYISFINWNWIGFHWCEKMYSLALSCLRDFKTYRFNEISVQWKKIAMLIEENTNKTKLEEIIYNIFIWKIWKDPKTFAEISSILIHSTCIVKGGYSPSLPIFSTRYEVWIHKNKN